MNTYYRRMSRGECVWMNPMQTLPFIDEAVVTRTYDTLPHLSCVVAMSAGGEALERIVSPAAVLPCRGDCFFKLFFPTSGIPFTGKKDDPR